MINKDYTKARGDNEDIKFSSGMVLIDNTTIYGAREAIEAWPPDPASWHNGKEAFALRSLIDIIEAIIIYDEIVVDSSSRKGNRFLDFDPWRDLFDLTDNNGEKIVRNITFISASIDLTSAALSHAADLLKICLQDGTIPNELTKFSKNLPKDVLHPFFIQPSVFLNYLKEYYNSKDFPPILSAKLRELLSSIDNQSQEIKSLAMFHFRGFYYQGIANLVGISYSPHTWRSGVINSTLKPFNIEKCIENVSSSVRKELENEMKNDLGIDLVTQEFPLFASFIVSQCTKRQDLLEVAKQVRNTKGARALREWIKDIQPKIRLKSNLAELKKEISALHGIVADVSKELKIEKKNREKLTIKVVGKIGPISISGELPLPIEFGAPSWIKRIFKRKPHLVFLRDIMKKSEALPAFAEKYASFIE